MLAQRWHFPSKRITDSVNIWINSKPFYSRFASEHSKLAHKISTIFFDFNRIFKQMKSAWIVKFDLCHWNWWRCRRREGFAFGASLVFYFNSFLPGESWPFLLFLFSSSSLILNRLEYRNSLVQIEILFEIHFQMPIFSFCLPSHVS